MGIPFDPAILFLKMYFAEIRNGQDTFTKMFTSTSTLIAKTNSITVEMLAYVHQNMHARLFIAALFATIKVCKVHKYSSK